MTERDVRLGTIQETLLIPLYGRAVENRKKEAVLRDPIAEELVAAIDYDFARFDDLPMLLGTVLRTSLFDRWVADFLAEHPTGTVVEIGTGLNTRYERTDNGQARWFDLDLPDVIELRRTFLTDMPRRTMIAASVTDEAWADTVAAHSGGPYLFAAEAVLPYLQETDVREVIGLLADRFPGSLLALDTSGPGHFDTQDQHDALGKVSARMQWACADPAQLTEWRPGVEVLASHTFSSLPAPMYDGLPAPVQDMLSSLAAQRLPRVEDYRLNLVRLP
ncbi:class I SAM-dependent methyltransferase [Streptomyces sp. DT2A-34]|uniref:class I SAM-dependent methyltransferase n=1 Tax=Streptomyces sp. DT2A-34 TaxID=3051182 RepID=UPI00265C160E|nr:class I SAM-dependent methyltransferase [Streptomyces sp. DT2A-34]MDO0911772.1 class I SAM-dependent methyltransferase [Streptomyces sp. DT2A-34]MDO0916753.1 class I SAM-dependent methyltransferase [Streptomyces sp. DT2A-34]